MFPIAEQCLAWLDARVEAILKDAPKGAVTIAVLAGAGHGDSLARGFAFGSALGANLGGGHAFVVVITAYTGSMVECDIAHAYRQAGKIGAHIMMQGAPRGPMIRLLRGRFNLVYDAFPYAPAAYCGKGLRTPPFVEPNMGGYRIFYDGYPKDNWRLIERQESQWEILSNSTGVGTADEIIEELLAPYELAPAPTAEECPPMTDAEGILLAGGNADAEAARVKAEKYVIVHNRAGGGGLVKEAPPAVFAAIIKRLAETGVGAVQVGGVADPPIDGAEDKRGLRVPLTCRLIKNSLGVVAIEGFLPYLAAATGKPCATLFGPTPRPVFLFPGHQGLLRIVDRENGRRDVPCAMPCFWGGDGVCWSRSWSLRCARGPMHPCFEKANPQKRLYCLNFVEPPVAAAEVGAWAETLAFGQPLIRGVA